MNESPTQITFLGIHAKVELTIYGYESSAVRGDNWLSVISKFESRVRQLEVRTPIQTHCLQQLSVELKELLDETRALVVFRTLEERIEFEIQREHFKCLNRVLPMYFISGQIAKKDLESIICFDFAVLENDLRKALSELEQASMRYPNRSQNERE